MLDRGGKFELYLAHEPDTGNDVVVKIATPALRSQREIAAELEHQSAILGELEHPNLVRLLGLENGEDPRYLVREHVDGVSLSSVLARRRQLPLEDFVPLVAQILKGVGHAHSRRILLHDLKPSKVMLCTKDGRANFVKLLDFGRAERLHSETASRASVDHLVGSAAYLAPEVIRGAAPDLRADVYALGVLCYVALSGRRPFESTDEAAIFSQTLNDRAPPLPRLVHSRLPPGLCQLIHRCLEKDRAMRPADANAMVEELIDVVPGAFFRLPRVGRPSAGHRAATPIPRPTPEATGDGSDPVVPSAHEPADELTGLGIRLPTLRAGRRSLTLAGISLLVGLLTGGLGSGVFDGRARVDADPALVPPVQPAARTAALVDAAPEAYEARCAPPPAPSASALATGSPLAARRESERTRRGTHGWDPRAPVEKRLRPTASTSSAPHVGDTAEAR